MWRGSWAVMFLVATAALAQASTGGTPCGAIGEPLHALGFCTVPVDCDQSPTFDSLIDCVFAAMPGQASLSYQAPDENERAALRHASEALLARSCSDALLPAVLEGNYRTLELGAEGLCALVEVGDDDGDGTVDRGWGTFVVRRAPARDVQLQAVHPLFDLGTGRQAAAVFEAVGAHSFALAGTHRHADPTPSTACHAGQSSSDVAQCRDSGMTAWTLASLEASSSLTFVQLHGMADAACASDVHVTEGFAGPLLPGKAAERLADAYQVVRPGAVVSRGGGTLDCTLDGTNNVQGRLVHGVPWNDVLTTPAAAPNGRFVHVEQASEHRVASDWVEAFEAAFPVLEGP